MSRSKADQPSTQAFTPQFGLVFCKRHTTSMLDSLAVWNFQNLIKINWKKVLRM